MINNMEFHFYEWLICQKHMTKEEFNKLNQAQFQLLKREFLDDLKKSIIIDINKNK